MKRGEIFYSQLDPTIGSEIKKTRPVLIISCDANNRGASTVTVIPITSNVERVYPFEVLLETCETQLPKQSKAQCHQIRTLSKLRFIGRPIGRIGILKMRQIENALKIHLNLS